MTEAKPKRRWFQFSIRELLLLTAIFALAVGWWLEHEHRMPEKIKQLEYSLRQSEKIKEYWRKLYEYERSYVTPAEQIRRHWQIIPQPSPNAPATG